MLLPNVFCGCRAARKQRYAASNASPSGKPTVLRCSSSSAKYPNVLSRNRKANKGPVSVVTTTAVTPGSVFSSLSSNSSERTGRSRSTARTTSLLFAENIFVSPSKLCSHFGDKLPVYDRVDLLPHWPVL